MRVRVSILLLEKCSVDARPSTNGCAHLFYAMNEKSCRCGIQGLKPYSESIDTKKTLLVRSVAAAVPKR